MPLLCALMAYIDLYSVSVVAQHNTNSYRLYSQPKRPRCHAIYYRNIPDTPRIVESSGVLQTANPFRKATHTQTEKIPQRKTQARPSSRRRSFPPCAAYASWCLLIAHLYSRSFDSSVLQTHSSL